MEIEIKKVNEARVRYCGISRPWKNFPFIDLDIFDPGIVSEDEQTYREMFVAIDDVAKVDDMYYSIKIDFILTLEEDFQYEVLDRRHVIKKGDHTRVTNAIRKDLRKNGSIRQYMMDMAVKLAHGIDTCNGMVPTTSRSEMEKFLNN